MAVAAVVMAIVLPLSEAVSFWLLLSEEAACRYIGPLCVQECCFLYCWQMGWLFLVQTGQYQAVNPRMIKGEVLETREKRAGNVK